MVEAGSIRQQHTMSVTLGMGFREVVTDEVVDLLLTGIRSPTEQVLAEA
jgi:hypothetical protein